MQLLHFHDGESGLGGLAPHRIPSIPMLEFLTLTVRLKNFLKTVPMRINSTLEIIVGSDSLRLQPTLNSLLAGYQWCLTWWRWCCLSCWLLPSDLSLNMLLSYPYLFHLLSCKSLFSFIHSHFSLNLNCCSYWI